MNDPNLKLDKRMELIRNAMNLFIDKYPSIQTEKQLCEFYASIFYVEMVKQFNSKLPNTISHELPDGLKAIEEINDFEDFTIDVALEYIRPVANQVILERNKQGNKSKLHE